MDPKVLEKHNIHNKTIESPPGSEVENAHHSQQQQQADRAPTTLPSISSPSFGSVFVPVNKEANSLMMDGPKSYTLLANSKPLPFTTDPFHLSLPSHSNFVSNIINNLNLGGLFGAEIPKIQVNLHLLKSIVLAYRP